MFGKIFRCRSKESTPEVSGITVMLLQSRLERFTEERLNAAMQQAWNRPFNEQAFYAVDMDGEGFLFKFDGAFFTGLHHDRHLDSKEVGKRQIPEWAKHSAFSKLSMKFPGGIPEDMSESMYRFIGRLVARLISPNTVGVFFEEAQIFVPNTEALVMTLKTGKNLTPSTLPGAA